MCGKEFSVIPYRYDKAKYCSNECRFKGKIGYTHTQETKEKMSKTAKTIKKPWVSRRIDLICKNCGIVFNVPLNQKDRKYCSNKCKAAQTPSGLDSPKNKRVVKNCEYCGKEFIARGHRIKNNQGRFCSMRCWGIYSRINMPKKNTNIEILLRKKLEYLGIKFKEQVAIERICVVDFLICNNIVINADGDYWHSLPKMIEKDKRQDKELNKLGYKIIRLKGSKIINDIKGCASIITEAIYEKKNG